MSSYCTVDISLSTSSSPPSPPTGCGGPGGWWWRVSVSPLTWPVAPLHPTEGERWWAEHQDTPHHTGHSHPLPGHSHSSSNCAPLSSHVPHQVQTLRQQVLPPVLGISSPPSPWRPHKWHWSNFPPRSYNSADYSSSHLTVKDREQQQQCRKVWTTLTERIYRIEGALCYYIFMMSCFL